MDDLPIIRVTSSLKPTLSCTRGSNGTDRSASFGDMPISTKGGEWEVVDLDQLAHGESGTVGAYSKVE